MKVSKEQMKAIAPNIGANADIFTPIINSQLEAYDINTKTRLAYFLSQVAFESGDFRELSENLNYSAKGLLRTFPKYFTASTAAHYERKPQAIANHVYANRNGNGNEASGDGWRYRGRGLIQLTFKENYRKYGYDQNPDVVMTPVIAVESALKFWKAHNLNIYADRKDFTGLTHKINGGYNGLEERRKYLSRALKVLV